MKSVFLSAFSVFFLSACATGPTSYGPATNQGALGFTNQQIEQNRFQVSFTGRNAEEAHKLALLRAAEITLAQNYSTFRVVGSATQGGRQGSPISSSIGIGFGNGGYYRGSGSNVGIGIGIDDIGQLMNGSKVTTNMEILLGNEPRNGMANIYDARSIVQSIRPTTFTN